MNKYVQILEEIPKRENFKFTFTGRDDVFLIYAFFENVEVNPLDIL